MANEKLLVPNVTVDSVRSFIRAIPTKDAAFKENVIYGVVIDVVNRTLGRQWLGNNIMGALAKRKATSDFLTIDVSNDRALSLKGQRLISFADALINLQLVPGFSEKVASLRTAKDNRIESAFAELEIAGILYQYNRQFAFLPEQPNAGRQPDFDVILSDGTVIKADVKCKLDGGPLTTSGLRNVLGKAVKQLPKDTPGAILMKIPQEWLDTLERQRALSELSFDFLKETRRVVSILHFCSRVTYGNSRTQANYHFHEALNANHRFEKRDWAILRSLPRPILKDGNAPHWISLMKIIDEEIVLRFGRSVT